MNTARLSFWLVVTLTPAIAVAQDGGGNSNEPPLPKTPALATPAAKNTASMNAQPAPCCGKAAETSPEKLAQASGAKLLRVSFTSNATPVKSREPADPAFEQFVDLEMLADAWRQMTPSALLDSALQFRQVEQILQREHKLISSHDLLEYAARAATANRDQATLKRLSRVAEKIKDQQLATLVQLAGESRAADVDDLAIPVDELSPAGFSVVKEVVEGIENAVTDGDADGLADLQKTVDAANELQGSQKQVLSARIADARKSLPKDGKNFAAVMKRLTGESRQVTQATANYIFNQMLTPAERRAVGDAALRTYWNSIVTNAQNDPTNAQGLTPALFNAIQNGTLGPLAPGQAIPPAVRNWQNDRSQDAVRSATNNPAFDFVEVDQVVNGVRVTYLVAPNGNTSALTLNQYNPNDPLFNPPQTDPLQQVPPINRPGLTVQANPITGVIGVPNPAGLRPRTNPLIRLINGLPFLIRGVGPNRFRVPIFRGPFGPVLGFPVVLAPNTVLQPLPASGPVTVPSLPPAPLAGAPTLTCKDVLGTWHEEFEVPAGSPGNRAAYVFTGGQTPLAGRFQMWIEQQDAQGEWQRLPNTERSGTYRIAPGSGDVKCQLNVVDTAGQPIMDIGITFLGHTQQNTINVILLQGDRSVNGQVGQANLIR